MQTSAPAGKFLLWVNNRDPKQNVFTKNIRSALRVIIICLREFKNNELSLRSAALTYTILLSLVPMLAMSTAIAKGVGGGDDLRAMAFRFIDSLEESSNELNQVLHHTTTAEENSQPADSNNQQTITPKENTTTSNEPTVSSGLTGHLRSAATQLFDYVDKTNFAALGTFGVVGIVLSILLVLSHIENTMNSIWHVQEGRPLMRKLSDYITLLILMPISISVGFAATAVLSNQNLNDKLDIIIPILWIQALFFKFIPVFFIAISLYVVYLFFPNTKVKTIPAMIGAFIAASGWFFAQNVYISLQVGVSKYNAIYGSFATFPLFLIWIYFGWIFILLGAQIGFAIQKRNSYPLVTSLTAPTFSLSAAFDVVDRVQDNYEAGKEITIEGVKDELPDYDHQTIDEVTNKLLRANVLIQAAEKKDIYPAKPKEKRTNKDIIKSIFGDETPETNGGMKSQEILASVIEEQTEKEDPSACSTNNEVETTPQEEKS